MFYITFATLAIAHDNLPVFKIDIFYTQLQAFAQSKPGAIEHTRHQPLHAVQRSQLALHFGHRKYRRYPRGALDAYAPVKPIQRLS